MFTIPVGIYYLGPKGSYSYEVAKRLKGKKIEARTITEVFDLVENSNGIGVVPIENSIEGPVNETLDNLFMRDNIFVVREIEIPIRIALCANKGIKNINEIKRLYAQPYAYSEAKPSIEKFIKNLEELIPVESTSKAAIMASKDPYGAALCSEFAARLYKLKVLLEDVQTGPNFTRFFIISKRLRVRGSKTLVFITVPHKPGGLYKALEKFFRHNINLTMIYSRPLKTIPWRYYFHIEFEGSLSLGKVRRAIDELKEYVEILKIKGSFVRSQYQA